MSTPHDPQHPFEPTEPDWQPAPGQGNPVEPPTTERMDVGRSPETPGSPYDLPEDDPDAPVSATPSSAPLPEDHRTDDLHRPAAPTEPVGRQVWADHEPPPHTGEAPDVAGQHRVERPVPRSGQTEQESTGYLTGERELPDQHAPGTAPPTQPIAHDQPPAAPWFSTTADEPVGDVPRGTRPAARVPDTAVMLEGSSVEQGPRSRAAAHWWGVLLTIVLLPIAWYLLADAGARLTLPAGNPWETGNLNIAALLELGSGLVVLTVALLTARWSSVGAIITGCLALVIGIPFVAVPAWTQNFLEPVMQWLRDFNELGVNLAHHFLVTGSTSRFVIYGLALVLLGIVSHGARRQGRREERVRPRTAAI